MMSPSSSLFSVKLAVPRGLAESFQIRKRLFTLTKMTGSKYKKYIANERQHQSENKKHQPNNFK